VTRTPCLLCSQMCLSAKRVCSGSGSLCTKLLSEFCVLFSVTCNNNNSVGRNDVQPRGCVFSSPFRVYASNEFPGMEGTARGSLDYTYIADLTFQYPAASLARSPSRA
jgi:hypothetical protein